MNLVLAAQARSAPRHFLQRIAADLLDRLAFVLNLRFAARRDALLRAALKRRYLLIVVLLSVLLVLDFVRRSSGFGAFAARLGAHWSLNGRLPDLRLIGLGRFWALERRIRGRALRGLAASGRDRARLVQNRFRRQTRAISVGLGRIPFGVRRRRRRRGEFVRPKVVRRRPFRKALDLFDPGLDLRSTRAPMAAAASFAARLFVLLALGQGFLFEQRLSIGDRNLIIVRMNFGEGKKTVAIAAIVDESRLEGRLDASDLGEVDIAAQRPLAR